MRKCSSTVQNTELIWGFYVHIFVLFFFKSNSDAPKIQTNAIMWLLTGSAMKSMVGRMTDPAITSRSSRARDLHHMKQKPKLRNLSETLPETPAMH